MLNSIFSSTVTVTELCVCLVMAMVLGLLNAMVFTYKSRHSASFSLTLALLPMAVAVVILLVNGNVGTGVAVAGAFTLVRFRSVPGTSREIVAIFADMVIGLALGMGYVSIAVLFFLFVAVFWILLTVTKFGVPAKHEKHLKILIPEDFDYDGLFDDVFEKYKVRAALEKIHTTNMGTLFELNYRVLFSDTKVPKAFVDELRARNGNLNISIGDYEDKEVL